MKHKTRLEGRIALVTGASRGLGRAVALALAREGAQVVAVARTTGALEELDDEIRAIGGTATILKLDLRAGERIDQVGPALYQRWKKLDIFVGAAGILGPLSPLPHVTADAWSSVMDVNLNANWRFIRTLDPLLRLSDAGRALFVTAGAASADTAYWGPYAVSKAGLEALAKTYAEEVANTPVRVSILDPGPMRTAMRAKAFPGEDTRLLTDPFDVAPLAVELVLPVPQANGTITRYEDRKHAEAVLPTH
ncbi:MAG: SDR family NAD(P)-dependent oxidoreductase [Hyphomicrobium sp.]|jgi:NAD(P)-dependent dehydrogenase (short-subunit alcohol dehydrogenase family)